MESEVIDCSSPIDLTTSAKEPVENDDDIIMLSDTDEEQEVPDLSKEELEALIASKKEQYMKDQEQLRAAESEAIMLKKMRNTQMAPPPPTPSQTAAVSLANGKSSSTPLAHQNGAHKPSTSSSPLTVGSVVSKPKPRQPQSGYQLFTSEKLASLAAVPHRERMVAVGRMWNQLSESERNRYNVKAEALYRVSQNVTHGSSNSALPIHGAGSTKLNPPQRPVAPVMMTKTPPTTAELAERQALAKVALRKQLEKTLLQIQPQKPTQPELNFIPSLASADFLFLLGLEEAVKGILQSGATSKPEVKYVFNPFTCVQCKTDFTPVWKRDRPGSKDVICEACVASNQKKAIRQEYKSRLKQAFVTALKQEQELEKLYQGQIAKAKEASREERANKAAAASAVSTTSAAASSSAAAIDSHRSSGTLGAPIEGELAQLLYVRQCLLAKGDSNSDNLARVIDDVAAGKFAEKEDPPTPVVDEAVGVDELFHELGSIGAASTNSRDSTDDVNGDLEDSDVVASACNAISFAETLATDVAHVMADVVDSIIEHEMFAFLNEPNDAHPTHSDDVPQSGEKPAAPVECSPKQSVPTALPHVRNQLDRAPATSFSSLASRVNGILSKNGSLDATRRREFIRQQNLIIMDQYNRTNKGSNTIKCPVVNPLVKLETPIGKLPSIFAFRGESDVLSPSDIIKNLKPKIYKLAPKVHEGVRVVRHLTNILPKVSTNDLHSQKLNGDTNKPDNTQAICEPNKLSSAKQLQLNKLTGFSRPVLDFSSELSISSTFEVRQKFNPHPSHPHMTDSEFTTALELARMRSKLPKASLSKRDEIDVFIEELMILNPTLKPNFARDNKVTSESQASEQVMKVKSKRTKKPNLKYVDEDRLLANKHLDEVIDAVIADSRNTHNTPKANFSSEVDSKFLIDRPDSPLHDTRNELTERQATPYLGKVESKLTFLSPKRPRMSSEVDLGDPLDSAPTESSDTSAGLLPLCSKPNIDILSLNHESMHKVKSEAELLPKNQVENAELFLQVLKNGGGESIRSSEVDLLFNPPRVSQFSAKEDNIQLYYKATPMCGLKLDNICAAVSHESKATITSPTVYISRKRPAWMKQNSRGIKCQDVSLFTSSPD